MYEAKNLVPEQHELDEQTNRGPKEKLSKEQKEYTMLKEKTLEKIPKLQELNDINDIIAADTN